MLQDDLRAEGAFLPVMDDYMMHSGIERSDNAGEKVMGKRSLMGYLAQGMHNRGAYRDVHEKYEAALASLLEQDDGDPVYGPRLDDSKKPDFSHRRAR
jgi:hypothetical protein